MRTLLEDDLVEAVISLCTAGRRPGVPSLQIRRFHAERERCYAQIDPDERQDAFARLHLAWFQEWQIAAQLTAAARRFPALADGLTTLAFRKARAQSDEGAELYANPEGQRQGIVALRPDRFLDPAGLDRLLHHELAHLADMVDERFGYSPLLTGSTPSAARERLVRERYRLLWNVSIDGRLTQRQLATVADELQRRAEFDRAFAFLPESRRADLFDDLWHARLTRHTELIALAVDPRELHDSHAPVPGAACPLCGFTDFKWIEVRSLRPAAQHRLHAEFPNLPAEQSVCARCAEIYESVPPLLDPDQSLAGR